MDAKLKILLQWPKKDIFDVVELFFDMFLCLNLIQFRICKLKIDNNHYKRYIVTNLWHWTMFYAALSLYLILVYHHVRSETLFKTNTPLFNYGNQLFLIAVYAVAIFATINNQILRYRFWDMIVRLHAIDIKLKNLKFPINHNLEFVFIISSFSVCLIYGVVILIYLILTDNFTWTQVVFETFPVILYCFLLAICYGVIVLYIFRFDMLNKVVQHYFIESVDLGPGSRLRLHDIDNYFDLIFLIRQIYADLCNCLDTINLCMSQHLMFCTGVSFIFLLLNWFSTYCVYFLDSSETTKNTVICIFLLSLPIFYILMLILGCGEKLKLEGLKTLKLINVIMIKLKHDKDMCYEMIKFSQQIRHKHPIFTCGLFPFDLTLINSMIGGLVSYMIILIQFQTSNMIF